MMKRLILAMYVFVTLFSSLAQGCTRVLLSGNTGTIVGRTMDWMDNTQPEVWIFPRGMIHKGGQHAQAAKWVSLYGSIIVSAYGQVVVDGINEARLAGQALYLGETDYGHHPPSASTIEANQWLQYILDRYDSVKAAVKDAPNWQIILSEVRGHKVSLHMALADKTGDSAIIEYIKGHVVIYHGNEHHVLTNAPSYALQRQDIRKYEGFGGHLKLPMGTHSQNRFVRASYFLEKSHQPKTTSQAMDGVHAIIDSVSISEGDYPTFYRIFVDITYGRYYFEYLPTKHQFWIDLKDLNFKEGEAVRYFNPIYHP